MKRKAYSAGAVKFSFWFLEFRKVVQLLASGKDYDEIKRLSEDENIFGAATPARAAMIYSTTTARAKSLDPSFIPLFMESDVTTQKLFTMTAVLAHDSLFFDFVYEVVREKLIIGNNELADSDIRVFFKNKQEQDEKVAKWQDYTLHRLGACYKTQLFEAGLLDGNKGADTRKIIKPILDPIFKHWLEDFGMGALAKAYEGVR